MWMLLGLAGLLMASSMVDVFAAGDEPDDPTGANDADDAGAAPTDAAPTGDLLADAGDELLPDDGGSGGLSPAVDAEMDADVDGLPHHESPRDDDAPPYGAWLEDEFISTDLPPLEPSDYYIRFGDDGDQAAGGGGGDTLLGGSGDDWLDGQGGDDQIFGGGGNDTLIGGPGMDMLVGGDGNDSLLSGSGDGVLFGGAGNDALVGGVDHDSLLGGTGDDTLLGGGGDDVLIAGEGSDLLLGGSGDDTLIGHTPGATGRDIGGADYLNGGDGDDVVVLGSGDIANGGGGADSFVLGEWIDPEQRAQITDFVSGLDSITIAYDANGAVPVLSAEPDADGGGMVLMLNGVPIALLAGLDTLDIDSISLMPVDANPV